MRGHKSFIDIFDNLIIKYLWTNEVQQTIYNQIQDKLKEKWQEDEANITTESMENVEKRQQLIAQQDENTIQNELLYQRYNVKVINEIFQYFENHGQGEDYIRLLTEAEENDDESCDSGSKSGSERHSSRVENLSTDENSGSVR